MADGEAEGFLPKFSSAGRLLFPSLHYHDLLCRLKKVPGSLQGMELHYRCRGVGKGTMALQENLIRVWKLSGFPF
jgi:hypothetical protein